MSTPILLTNHSLLPWDETRADRYRLWIPALLLLLLSLLFVVLIQFAPPVEHERYVPQETPERWANFIKEQKQKPIVPEKKPDVKKKEQKKEKPKVEKKEAVTETKPKPKTEPKPQPEPEPVTTQPTQQQIQAARAKAQKHVAVFKDAFAGLRDMAPTTGLAGMGGTGAMAGTANDLQRGGAKSASLKPGRDLIAVAASKGSSAAALVGAGRASGNGTVGANGNGRLKGYGKGKTVAGGGKVHSKLASSNAGSTTVHKSSGQASRSQEQIRRVFDRYAGRLNSQYQRALRKNPTLQGTVVLHLVIEPSGKVSKVKVEKSDLDAPKLLMRIRIIVMGMNFGAMDVETWKGNYSLNFFPS